METRVRYIVVGLFVLVVGAAALFLSLWIQSGGTIRARRNVEIRFEGPTPGLHVGTEVTFNGLRVGEVTAVSFDPRNPNWVDARVSIDAATPLSATTKVSLDIEGLMGSTYLSLYGGTASHPLVTPPERTMPLLVAPAQPSLTQDARQTLAQFQGLIGDNSKPLHELIENLKTFSDVLASNSKRVDKILAGLEQMTGGGEKPPPPSTFDLAAPSLGTLLVNVPQTQLVINDPKSIVTLDTQKFLSEKPDGQLVLQSAQWSDAIPQLVQKKILQTFQNAHYRFASLPADGLNPDYQLLLNIRKFETVQGNKLMAAVAFDAQLMDHSGKIVGTQLIQHEVPATASDGSAAAQAMTQAFAGAAADLLTWYGQTIEHIKH